MASFAYIKDVSVAVTNVPRWTDADIEAYLDEITTLGSRVPARASLTEFRGAMFSAHERRVVVDWLAKNQIAAGSRTCLLTGSALFRGAITAYAWMTGTEGAAFDPSDKKRACAWVAEGSQASKEEVLVALDRCYLLLGFEPP
jgi:hypothetical protein